MTAGHAVVVGASLAGLRGAEALRAHGFTGRLTIVGDEPHPPYDRPPLSKRVVAGQMPAADAGLPALRAVDATWRLGVPATGLDLAANTVVLGDGERIGFDRLLIATGTRARPWPAADEASLTGVCTLRGLDDAARLHALLAAGPRRVLVIGAGFIGAEIASACRVRGLAVTVTERGSAPLAGALGGPAGTAATRLLRGGGVDLRTHTTVLALEGDAHGQVRRARLSDGDYLDVDVVVVALGALRNVEWLADSGLAVDRRGVVCDATCRVYRADGVDGAVHQDVFAAGDVARWPHPLFGAEPIGVEHWDNAVRQAGVAGANMARGAAGTATHTALPRFWSNQFGVSIKSVGMPTVADRVAVVQGSTEQRRFVAVYGRDGRMVAALAVNAPRALEAYAAQIEARAPFPPPLVAADAPAELRVLDNTLPAPGQATHSAVWTQASTPPVELDARTPFAHPPL